MDTSAPAPHSRDPEKPRSALDWIVDALALIAGIILVALTVLVCVDVAVRNLFTTFSAPWIPELNEYLLYGLTFLGAPWVLRDQGHIVVDLVTQSLSPRMKRRFSLVTSVIGMIVCLLLCYYSTRVLIRSYEDNTLIRETWEFPEWWPMLVVPPVFLLLAVIFLRWILRPPAPPEAAEADEGL